MPAITVSPGYQGFFQRRCFQSREGSRPGDSPSRSMPVFSPSAAAKKLFSAQLWSVTAIRSRASSLARRTMAAGDISSEAQGDRVEWMCKSAAIFIVGNHLKKKTPECQTRRPRSGR